MSKPAARVRTKAGANAGTKSAAEAGAKTGAKTGAKAATASSRAAGKPKSSNGKRQVRTIAKSDRAKAGQMLELLCQRYPEADCELTFANDFELLISVILSAQTTDVQVNKVTPGLFAAFPTPQALAEAPPRAVQELIRPTGYYNAKAKNIQACSAGLVERFAGCVPKTQAELMTMPGVGRKTANVVLGVLHDIPGWTVDTHVQRLSNRLGLTRNADPAKIEKDLEKLFSREDWNQNSITLIWHGRRICYARKPDCPACPIAHLCPSSSL